MFDKIAGKLDEITHEQWDCVSRSLGANGCVMQAGRCSYINDSKENSVVRDLDVKRNL